jgi:hypothetical protein
MQLWDLPKQRFFIVGLQSHAVGDSARDRAKRNPTDETAIEIRSVSGVCSTPGLDSESEPNVGSSR